MTYGNKIFSQEATKYLNTLQEVFKPKIIEEIECLSKSLLKAWINNNQVFICGNGGSAANAIHIANDFHYGIGACGAPPHLPGLRVEALPANSAILTCLANDTGYDNIYSHQIEVKSRPGDILIALSGSGNSGNIIKAISTAKKYSVETFAILAFNGGKCKNIADTPIHFEVEDMQIAEDTQLIVGHLCMQWLNKHKPNSLKER